MPHFLPQKMNSSKLPLSCLFMADSALFAKKNYLDPAMPENTEKI
jgi:hypothetical protein